LKDDNVEDSEVIAIITIINMLNVIIKIVTGPQT